MHNSFSLQVKNNIRNYLFTSWISSVRDGLWCVKIIWLTGQENVATLLNEFLKLGFNLSAVLSKYEGSNETHKL